MGEGQTAGTFASFAPGGRNRPHACSRVVRSRIRSRAGKSSMQRYETRKPHKHKREMHTVWYRGTPSRAVAQIFGTKYLSSLFGIVFLSHQVGAFIGAYLGGYFYDQFGSYDYAFYMAIALSIFATIVHYPINEQPIQRSEATI